MLKSSFILIACIVIGILVLWNFTIGQLSSSSLQTVDSRAIFALSWLHTFCLTKTCNPTVLDSWDHHSLTIHGLWPTSFPYAPKIDFDISLFDRVLLADMNKYMPPNAGNGLNQEWLWQHQLQKHGKDYVYVLKQLGSTQSLEQLQVLYFQNMLKTYKDLHLTNLSQKIWTKRQLAIKLGLKEDQFYLQCISGSILSQLRICLNITTTSLNPIRCIRPQPKLCDNNNIVLQGWTSHTPEDESFIDL